ncbi:MAG: diguanylate cyclase [Candidatus Pristimantibacillus lignocellulolyticus]|uniref:Diguanylate cyclase n=1 Tax=Candidatus Pristimantibacillus lignocellulolyticus TaxID=2994561 RepID=A0A9J6Z9B8_9BACL|nr:MAG: diguanylate cyclase [Candidatus Pristimantibacillus lignocellulolyticus]
MKRFQNSFLSDVAFLSFIVVCIVMTIFVSSDPNAYVVNVILLNAAFLIAIITYFSTMMTGLILNLLFIFGYGSFTIYQAVTLGELVGTSNYFWLVMTPIVTILAWLLTQTNRKLQEENDHLQRQSLTLVMLDEKTRLKNTLSYQQDITTFMALSERYKIPLTLLVINVKYWDEIKRIMTAEKFSSALLEVSDISQSLVRTNDSLYLLNNENPTWGIVLFTDIEGASIVIKRFKDKINELNEYEFKEKYAVELQLRIGTAQYDPQNPVSPLELISVAKRTMEYDV